MLSRTKLFMRQSWYSICSKHREHDAQCEMCKAGDWYFDAVVRLSQRIHKRVPRLWTWWANLW